MLRSLLHLLIRAPLPLHHRWRWTLRMTRWLFDKHFPERKPELATAFSTLPLEALHTAEQGKSATTRSKNSLNTSLSDRHVPICLCMVRNDFERMRLFLQHYRKLGITHFAIVDNNSTDGTRKLLASQPDVDLYSMDISFSGVRKNAALNRLLSHYGNDRWYLVVDSDELLCYHGMGQHSLSDVVQRAEVLGHSALRGYMVDMYAEHTDLGHMLRAETIESTCCLYDTDSYQLWDIPLPNSVWGGPRQRALDNKQLLMKTPLFRHTRKNFIATCHYLYPASTAAPYVFALRHYKLIGAQDVANYRERLLQGSMLAGSMEYKGYHLEASTPTAPNFRYANTARWVDNKAALDTLPYLYNLFTNKTTI